MENKAAVMDKADGQSMSQFELNKLETQVETLLTTHERLARENRSLRSQLTKAMRERAHLLEQKQQAIGKVKRIITQLKEEIR